MAQKTSGGVSSADIALLRLMNSTNIAPQLNLAPVNNIGSGITQGVQNVLTQVMAARQRNQMMQILQQQAMQQQAEQAQAQAAQEQAYQRLGLPTEYMHLDKTIQNTLITDQLKQNAAAQEFSQKRALAAQTSKELQASGVPQATADLLVTQQFFGERAIPGIDGFGSVEGDRYRLNTANQYIPGGMATLNTNPASPALETTLGVLGVKPVDALDASNERLGYKTAETNAAFLPAEKQAALTGQNLSNIGAGINNQNEALQLQNYQDLIKFNQDYASGAYGQMTPDEYRRAIGALLISSEGTTGLVNLSNLGGDKDLKKGFQGLQQPAPVSPQAETQGSYLPTLEVPQNSSIGQLNQAFNQYQQFSQLTPDEQRKQSGQFRQGILGSLGQAGSKFGNEALRANPITAPFANFQQYQDQIGGAFAPIQRLLGY